ncbi:MAG TPA: hypothetical protein VHZ96_01140 [Frankiaceae bacterium]|nr:hypothetical protein [Frankiaceae bacterium]
MARAQTPGRGTLLGLAAAGCVAASVAATVAAAAPAVAASTSATPSMTTVSGAVRSVDYAHKRFTLQGTHGSVTVSLASGARVQVHGLATPLSAMRVGMLAFAEGSPAGAGRMSAKLVQGLLVAHQQTVVTGVVSTVDAAGATIVVEPGPYLRAVVLVPSGASLRRGGKPVALGAVRAGAVVTVHGYQDVQDPAEVVATSATFQSAQFSADLRGSVVSVDATRRLLKVRSGSGKVTVVSVPLTAPVLAGGEAFALDGLQPGTGVSVAFARAFAGRVVRTSGGLAVARIVADDQAAY